MERSRHSLSSRCDYDGLVGPGEPPWLVVPLIGHTSDIGELGHSYITSVVTSAVMTDAEVSIG